jgi:hypothetical protein
MSHEFENLKLVPKDCNAYSEIFCLVEMHCTV